MSSQKRLLLFVALSVVLMYGTQTFMERMGLLPKPQKPAPAAANQDAVKPAEAQANPQPAVAEAKPAVPGEPPQVKAPARPEPEPARPGELVLGSDDDPSPGAYRLRLVFDQRGAAVRELLSAIYDGETADGIPDRQKSLALVQDNPLSSAPLPFAMTIQSGNKPPGEGAFPQGEEPLDSHRWEVVRDAPGGPAVRPVTKARADGTQVEGQEIAFRRAVDDPAVTVTKRFRIFKGEDGFELSLSFESPKDERVRYRLFGPHGIPIEGESYTANFRDVFFGQVKGNSVSVATLAAADVVKKMAEPETYSSLPLKFTGIENQYFAVFLEPSPTPETTADPRVEKAMPFVARKIETATQKSDVGVEIVSGAFDVAPGHAATYDFKVFAGPKTRDALAAYGAADLASYRKYQLITIPFASSLSQYVIAPLLDHIYAATAWVARLFGFQKGNYGIAIILLTITVRLMIFPVGRKQAMISKKMQELQPHMAAIKEKYKDDKERQTKETLEIYRQHGFNPAAGCLPALIQLPIFVGLWQTLNNSVALRHSTFLYIKNLAAPDMLFRFPTELPIVGKYFNLLPFFVVALMLVQTKLFSPPAVTEEQRMQQKMMKYMMVFMAFMFYRVPSGLGLYFITSSLWSVGERLLLPKLTGTKRVEADGDGNGQAAVLVGPQKPAGGMNGWLSKKLESLLEQASAERTIRNDAGNGRSPEPERNRNRPKPGKRR
jgi:YidC/Oxa1 family membrane protein insertase